LLRWRQKCEGQREVGGGGEGEGGAFAARTFLTRTHPHATHATASAAELKSDLVIAPDAIEALRCAAEAHLTGMFEEAALATVHGKREETLVQDLRLRNFSWGR
jgi:hypothetical protein